MVKQNTRNRTRDGVLFLDTEADSWEEGLTGEAVGVAGRRQLVPLPCIAINRDGFTRRLMKRLPSWETRHYINSLDWEKPYVCDNHLVKHECIILYVGAVVLC